MNVVTPTSAVKNRSRTVMNGKGEWEEDRIKSESQSCNGMDRLYELIRKDADIFTGV